MPQEFIDILKSQGLAGVVIFFLGWAVIRLYNRNQKLHDTLNELGRESVKANEQMTSALNKVGDGNVSIVRVSQQMDDNIKQLLWRHGIKAETRGD